MYQYSVTGISRGSDSLDYYVNHSGIDSLNDIVRALQDMISDDMNAEGVSITLNIKRSGEQFSVDDTGPNIFKTEFQELF